MAAPAAPLGEVHGLHLLLLAIEMWPEHSGLRIALHGPEGWFDDEPMGPRGRRVVTDGSGRTESSLLGGLAGREELSIGEVVLPPFSPDAGPWDVTLYRAGQQRPVTIPDSAAVRLTPRPPTVLADPPTPDGRARCSRCTTPLTGADGRCDRCRQCMDSVLDARLALGGGPDSEALVADLGPTGWGKVSVLALERWPGWSTLVLHVAQEAEATVGGLIGAWRMEDDLGHAAPGCEVHGSGGDHGWTSDVCFPGRLDDAASVLTLSLTNQERTVLSVELPITPGGAGPTGA